MTIAIERRCMRRRLCEYYFRKVAPSYLHEAFFWLLIVLVAVWVGALVKVWH